MNWIRIKLWFANIFGFLAAYPIFAWVLFGIVLFVVFFGVITSQHCGSKSPDWEKIEKQSRENEKRRKEELENTFKEVNRRIENTDASVNKAKTQDLSNKNNKELESEIERKAKQF